MTTNVWTIEQFGGEHNARAEQQQADDLRADRFRALDGAGPCPECGWSGTVPVYTGAGFRLVGKCPNGCEQRR